MTLAVYAVIGVPFVAAILLTLVRSYRAASALNVLASGGVFAAALTFLTLPPVAKTYIILDDLNIFFIILNTLVGFTTSIFSWGYISHEIQNRDLKPRLVRFYHAMFQAMMGGMNLALLANNIGLMWVGLEFATLMTVIAVGMYRTAAALEAAWKYFVLGIVGISLAFFGTIIVYLAGQAVLGEGAPAMTWSRLIEVAPQLDSALLSLAFIFLLVGYGTKVGLAPLHAWLPDAHAEGPTPISAVLSGLLLNVALFALLRFKMVLAANPDALKPGPIMVTIGLISLIFAAFMLYQRRDLKRLFAYSSIEHMGLITFTFGMGGPLANFAGLLHMVMHSLTKSAIFFAVGHVMLAKGTKQIAEIRGLSISNPALAAALAAGVIAISGLPPFGAFTSEFLILTTTFAREPWLAAVAGFGLLVAFGGLLLCLQNVLFGSPDAPSQRVKASTGPLIVHLSLVLLAGLYLPTALVSWFHRAAELLG